MKARDVYNAMTTLVHTFNDDITRLEVVLEATRMIGALTGKDKFFELAEGIDMRLEELDEEQDEDGPFVAFDLIGTPTPCDDPECDCTGEYEPSNDDVTFESLIYSEDKPIPEGYQAWLDEYFLSEPVGVSDEEFIVEGDDENEVDFCLVEELDGDYTMRVTEDYRFTIASIDCLNKKGKIVERFIIVERDGTLICDNDNKAYKTKQKALKAVWKMFGSEDE